MSTYNGENYTGFRGVNLKNSAVIRVESEGYAGTLAVKNAADQAYAWYFPQKSGTFPIMGTFSVQLPTATAAEFNTIVTVTGIRTEDALVVLPNKHNSAAYGFENTTSYILTAVQPGDGQITLFFTNLGNATGYVDQWYSYLAAR